MKCKRKLSKKWIKFIAILFVAAVITVSLAVTNLFIPVKYLSAYINFKKDICPQGEMRVRYIDVGYGDSALVELPDGKTLLIDGGAGTYSNARKILKILNSSGIDRIDYLVCTSVKNEHCGGFSEIIRYKSVGKAYIPYVENKDITDGYSNFYSMLSSQGVPTETAEYGKGVYSSEYKYCFYFLSPSVYNLPDSEYKNMNRSPTNENIDAASAVLWLEYSGKGFLFLSDADGGVQTKIARSVAAEKGRYVLGGLELTMGDCAVISAANHCGVNSACAELYDLIKPEAAIISVGENAKNSPSLSDFAVLQTYVGDKIYRTDRNGTITAVVSGGLCYIDKEN